MNQVTFPQAIRQALNECMDEDENVLCFGLGATDPKGIFDTTTGLKQAFGAARVFDTPTSENGMTGIGIGMSIGGLRPVMCHQRLDFFLLAMDQLVNSAAKWHYMFGGSQNIPITIRLIVGRGWGQGPTHSQSLQSWFAHIPGLKVMMPSSAADAYLMLKTAIKDPDPVVFLEHRWLYNSISCINGLFWVQDTPIISKVLRQGDDITIVAYSYMCAEALKAAEYLADLGMSVEILDIRSIKPIDWNGIIDSVRKTKRLLALDSSHELCSVASEIVARISIDLFDLMEAAPMRLALPDCPEPTSYSLTKSYYYGAKEIICACLASVGREDKDFALRSSYFDTEAGPHDVPGDWFKGPF